MIGIFIYIYVKEKKKRTQISDQIKHVHIYYRTKVERKFFITPLKFELSP